MFLSSRQVPHYSFVSFFFSFFDLLLFGGGKEKGKGDKMQKVRSVQRVSCFEGIDSSNRNRLGSTNCLGRTLSSLTLILVAATPACVTRYQFRYHHVFLGKVRSHLRDHRNRRRLVDVRLVSIKRGEARREKLTVASTIVTTFETVVSSTAMETAIVSAARAGVIGCSVDSNDSSIEAFISQSKIPKHDDMC